MVNKFLKYLMYLSVKKRLGQFEVAIANPKYAQTERLKTIVSRNMLTQFGKINSFSSIKSIDDYKKSVPIQNYEGFKPYIDAMLKGEENVLVSDNVEMFGVTSGSTAAPKFIPITRSFILEYHNSHLIWMYRMVEARSSGVVGGIFSMVSPAEAGRTSGNIPYGATSGKQYRDQSIPIRALHPVPYSVFLTSEPTTKYHLALIFAMRSDIRVVNSVNPSTLIMLADILAKNGEELIDDLQRGQLNNAPLLSENEKSEFSKLLKPSPERARKLREILATDGVLTPKSVWPNLCAINTWQGGNAPFYLKKVAPLWGEASQRCLGLRATEGIFSIPLDDFTSSAVLAVNGHFMEFVEESEDLKEDSETLLAHELEVGGRYRMIITTSSGLYRYDLGDIVEVTKMRKNTPEVSFLHKAGGVLSVTGEKVYEDQVVEAMAEITSKLDYDISGFSVTLELGDIVRYVLAIELAGEVAEVRIRELIELFDSSLSNKNIEYKDKRSSGRLGAPVILILRKNSYRDYRDVLIKNGRPDGQIKPPHIILPSGVGIQPLSGSLFFDTVKVLSRVE